MEFSVDAVLNGAVPATKPSSSSCYNHVGDSETYPSKLEISIERLENESSTFYSGKFEGLDLGQLRSIELSCLALSRDIARACDDMASILLCFYGPPE